MAQISGTHSTYDATNIQEKDIRKIIMDVSPFDTPFLSMIGEGAANAVTHEWNTDALSSVDANNAQIEGDAFTYTTLTDATRNTNVTQISRKGIVISGTTMAVKTTHGGTEYARQLVKVGRELKRDMETILTGNQASVAGDDTTGRKLRSLEAWYISGNSNRGTGGAAGSTTQAATDATTANLRPFKEDLLKSALKSVYEAGGDVDVIMLGPKNKQELSAFAGNAGRQIDAKLRRLETAVDVYVSDFSAEGIKVIPNRFQRARTVHLLQSDMFKVAYLRPMKEIKPAKTADAETAVLLTEYTLAVLDPKSSGVIADLTS